MKPTRSIQIEHSKIIDGFNQLRGFHRYIAFSTYCGICDRPIELSPDEQKYLLEVNQVPVKMLQRGAAYCEQCVARRSRINNLTMGDKWRSEMNGRQELERLKAEEEETESHSQRLFERAPWPYRAAF